MDRLPAQELVPAKPVSQPRLKMFGGARSDWIRKPASLVKRSGLWGAALVLFTFVVSALAFVPMSMQSDEDAVGLAVGMLSIVAMAWCFTLALRVRWLERLFGGLDQMYVVHRWLGVIAIILMFWHIRSSNAVNGVPGADAAAAELGEMLGGAAEFLLYTLVIVSILRWIPYKWWRITHLLMGVPFIFACFHVWTAEKPFANLSTWGLWFALIMAVGTVAYMWRLILRDRATNSFRYTITETEDLPGAVRICMMPVGRPMPRECGQFAFLRMFGSGPFAEPHPFSVASDPHDDGLIFYIKRLGDWTQALDAESLVGKQVRVEGPFGHLDLRGSVSGERTVWVAAGVGITPFLSALNSPHPEGTGRVPDLIYAVRGRDQAHAIELVEAAAQAGKVNLQVVDSTRGESLDKDSLGAILGEQGLKEAHVVVCGPQGVIDLVRRQARRQGALACESETFDIRGALGPELSMFWATIIRRIKNKSKRKTAS